MGPGMHELAITENIRDIALRHAEEAGAARITGIRLVIGQLSTVVDDSVQFYWDFVTEGTLAEGGRLHFQRIPARLLCLDCDQPYTLKGTVLSPCPRCDGVRIRILEGDEFRLESIDIEP